MTRKLHIAFDLAKQRSAARTFLTELGARKLPLAVISVTRDEELAPTQRATVMIARMREVDMVVVLVGPQSSVSRPLAEEIAFAREAGTPIVGVLVDGAAVDVNLPKGLARDRVYGWDWGQLGRALRKSRS